MKTRGVATRLIRRAGRTPNPWVACLEPQLAPISSWLVLHHYRNFEPVRPGRWQVSSPTFGTPQPRVRISIPQ